VWRPPLRLLPLPRAAFPPSSANHLPPQRSPKRAFPLLPPATTRSAILAARDRVRQLGDTMPNAILSVMTFSANILGWPCRFHTIRLHSLPSLAPWEGFSLLPFPRPGADDGARFTVKREIAE